MDFEALLGRQLKDGDVIELLEAEDITVTYDFDRLNEGEEDHYWAAAEASGFLFRFNQHQKLDVVFLYIDAIQGYESINPDEVEIPLYANYEAARQDFLQLGIPFTESSIPGLSWINGDFGSNFRHYQFDADSLELVTLSAKGL